ncbi:dnaJ homolog subfamily B member 14 [Drosophila grimshawi]|uniref:GH20391 n=1 Tax=Drosophila grimshawi TaxID=7222 RepID=B4J3W0_DROGR|nr:dnaJ homolog subfamily B member 14 [Drosophila grimshawi]EDW01543.1 GH20391 [Drosophila grimshawi]
MYINPKFLLTHAAPGHRSSATATQNFVAQHEPHFVANCLKSTVSELSIGNYDLAMSTINEALTHIGNSNHEDITALLELKNIVVRLRLRREMPDQLIGPTNKSKALPHSFSVEMLDLVQKVLRCRNHYEVLRISHHATYSEVKRAYKRLALRLHPDKNRAPGSEEAFRCINEAADTLTDNQKRIEYNLLTAVGDSFRSSASLYDNHRNIVPDQEFFDPDELRRSYQAANQRVPQRQSLYQTEQLVIGLVAALIFIIITLHYLAMAPNYSFTQTSTHSVRQVSRLNGITYFVTPQFAGSQTPMQQQRLEQDVEQIFVTDLKYNCKQERKLRDKLLQRARNINNQKLRDHALRMPTPACHALDKFTELMYKSQLSENNSKDNET